ncbi:membrane transporter, putative [Bodo saltans]|uniref:Membrane transporter, putative n=1 Tax=Bodo saltans TaxID=75058 RepID=A0A0S4JZ61_BODSA|nr:membrane transporter, putative [Bodo saltans]|eukprot:CUG94420.1 membrane transporter, putative [Bodo saltans]
MSTREPDDGGHSGIGGAQEEALGAASQKKKMLTKLDPEKLHTFDDARHSRETNNRSGGTSPSDNGIVQPLPTFARLNDDVDDFATSPSASTFSFQDRRQRVPGIPLLLEGLHSFIDSVSEFWFLLFSHTFRHYLIDLTRLAVPTCLTQMLRYSCNLISTVYCGHMLDSTHFGAVSTGLTFTTLTALSLGAGISSAMDTLSTQAHGRTVSASKGQKKKDEVSENVDDVGNSPHEATVADSSRDAEESRDENLTSPCCSHQQQGKYLRQSLVVTYAAYAPVAILYLACGPLIRLVVAEEMANLVIIFLQLSVFIVVPMLATNNLIRFSQSQRQPMIGFYASLIGAVALIPILYVVRPVSVASVAWCLALNRWGTLGAVLILTYRHEDLKRSWGPGWVASYRAGELALPELRTYFAVGLPSMLANMADTWSFELMSVLAASVSDITSATWSVLFTIYGVLFSGFVGIAGAASITVGNAVGQGSVHCAQSYAKAVLVLTTSCGAVLALLLFAVGGAMFGLIQSNPEVTSAGENLMNLGAFTFFMDVTFYVMQGIYRGIGQQRLCAITVFVGMWLVTIPSAWFLTKVLDGGVTAILTGLTLGLCVSTPLQWYLLFYYINWESCIDVAKLREKNTTPDERDEDGTGRLAAAEHSPPVMHRVVVAVVDDGQNHHELESPDAGEIQT